MLDGYSRYGDLIRMLVVKEFKVRYRNSALGFLWSLLNPLAMMVILTIFYTFVFSSSSIANYPVFVLPALLAWRFFAIGTQSSLDAIAGNSALVTKVYFPRILLVLSGNLANAIGSTLEFIALMPLMIVLGLRLTVFSLLLPVILVLEFILIFGLSLLLSSVSVFYRDFNQIWEILLQAGFFLSPIFYSQDLIPSSMLTVYSLNPVERIVVATRQVLYYGGPPTAIDFAGLMLSGLLLLGIGLLAFRHFEERFGELV